MGDPAELLLTRRSVGKVSDDEVPRTTIERLIAAAVQAPNHQLTEPWRFIVLTGSARRRVGDAHANAYRRATAVTSDTSIERERARLERAPVVICVVVRTEGPDPVRAREDRDAVACAVQNLLLAAHAHGLGAMWRTGTMVDEPAVHAALDLQPGDAIVAFVYLGHPSGTGGEKPRRPLHEVVTWCHD